MERTKSFITKICPICKSKYVVNQKNKKYTEITSHYSISFFESLDQANLMMNLLLLCDSWHI